MSYLNPLKKDYFRSLITKDPQYLVSKQKLMQPIPDFSRLGESLKVTKKGNWLTEMVREHSFMRGVEAASDVSDSSSSSSGEKYFTKSL